MSHSSYDSEGRLVTSSCDQPCCEPAPGFPLNPQGSLAGQGDRANVDPLAWAKGANP